MFADPPCTGKSVHNAFLNAAADSNCYQVYGDAVTVTLARVLAEVKGNPFETFCK
jgi:hypothetical protein